jgi:hypothetical protein
LLVNGCRCDTGENGEYEQTEEEKGKAEDDDDEEEEGRGSIGSI